MPLRDPLLLIPACARRSHYNRLAHFRLLNLLLWRQELLNGVADPPEESESEEEGEERGGLFPRAGAFDDRHDGGVGWDAEFAILIVG